MSRAATSRLKVNPALGVLPVLQYCTPEHLRIDEAYQRSLEATASQTLVRRIAMFWDWALCQPLVVARRSDNELYVVDGQHRLAAARMRGDIAQLPCVVTQYANAADEAASFVALNQQRRPLGALDLFKAALAAEDETACAITGLMEQTGLSLAKHTNFTAWKPGQVVNVTGIFNAYRQHGQGITRAAMMILSKAFSGQILRYAGTIFPGIVEVLAKDRAVSHVALIDVLKATRQDQWRTKVAHHRAKNPNDRYQMAAGKVIRAALDVRLGISSAAKQVIIAQPPQRIVSPAPSTSAAMRQPPALSAGKKSWCQQCDRNIDLAAAALCQSKFCSLRKDKAA